MRIANVEKQSKGTTVITFDDGSVAIRHVVNRRGFDVVGENDTMTPQQVRVYAEYREIFEKPTDGWL
jgi:hypothetical protein